MVTCTRHVSATIVALGALVLSAGWLGCAADSVDPGEGDETVPPSSSTRKDSGTGSESPSFEAGFDDARFHYEARVFTGARFTAAGTAPARARPDGALCVTLPHHADGGALRDDDASRYTIVDIANGQAPGVLRAHLYDLGPKRGFVLVGIERPFDASPPS